MLLKEVSSLKEAYMYQNKLVTLAILISIGAFCMVADAGLILPAKDSIQVDVSPPSGIKSGAIYLEDIILLEGANFYNYTYKITFTGFTADKIPTRVWLQIFNETNITWNDPGIIIETGKHREVEKKVNVAKAVGEYLGKVKYRIISDPRNVKDSVLYNSTGPEITVNFKNEKFEKTGEDTYSYSADVRSSLGAIDIYLYYKDLPDASWNYYSELQTYRNPKVNGTNTNEWISISWEDAPHFSRVEFAL
jgi:hypothetical protein